jgi:hypothetical protein
LIFFTFSSEFMQLFSPSQQRVGPARKLISVLDIYKPLRIILKRGCRSETRLPLALIPALLNACLLLRRHPTSFSINSSYILAPLYAALAALKVHRDGAVWALPVFVALTNTVQTLPVLVAIFETGSLTTILRTPSRKAHALSSLAHTTRRQVSLFVYMPATVVRAWDILNT